ncbi:hypothetical protein EJB05_11470, partial [Eragrostis curvula]
MASRSMRRAALLLCACLLAGAAASSGAGRHRPDDVTGDDLLIMAERFRAWQAAHNRTYATAAERRRRFEVYRRNVEHIEATNRRGGLSYELGENQFADLTREEFLAAYTMQPRHVLASRNAMRRLVVANGSVRVGGHRNGSYADDDFFGAAVPNSVDWRSKGAATPARSQMGCAATVFAVISSAAATVFAVIFLQPQLQLNVRACAGSCWAFATVASIESLYKLKTGRLVPLSEQELVDCDVAGDHGCGGGWPGVAMVWIARNGGLAAASDYPYESKQGQCRRDKARSLVRIRGGEPVARNDEAALEVAVARQPVTVIMNAAGFQFYKGGVLSGACDARPNHAVTVVGYGAEPGIGGRKFWIVKNSWGEGWGEKGYVRMARRVKAKEGQCGIAMMPHYPVM